MPLISSEAVIISKTKMENNFCMSAIDLNSLKNLRLMVQGLNYFPPSGNLEIGTILKVKYEHKRKINIPHTEDVIVEDYQTSGKIENLRDFIIQKKLITWQGDINNVFDGLLKWSKNGSGYIPESGPFPSVSVGFWLPHNPLVKFKNFKGVYYRILNHKRYYVNKKIKYVGVEFPIEELTGQIIRLSLSRLFPKEPNEYIFRGYYLQLSGWF